MPEACFNHIEQLRSPSPLLHLFTWLNSGHVTIFTALLAPAVQNCLETVLLHKPPPPPLFHTRTHTLSHTSGQRYFCRKHRDSPHVGPAQGQHNVSFAVAECDILTEHGIEVMQFVHFCAVKLELGVVEGSCLLL